MLWNKGRRSNNVVDAGDGGGSGGGGGMRFGGKGLSLTGVILIVGIGWLSGQSPMQILSELMGQAQTDPSPVTQQHAPQAPADTEQTNFVRSVLGSTEDTWTTIFQQAGRTYTAPTLVLFHNRVASGCGNASSAVGPFYCPTDQRVYLDLSFFTELSQRFAAEGDFARAYVIAHEVGHHVQNLLGVAAKVDAARQHGARMEGATGLSVRQELQADCFAGVWAYHAQQQLHWLEPGDVEKALNAANAIGDDRLQQQGQGRVVPDSFTHGTSAQRVHWFQAGFAQGRIDQCDTFKASSL